MTGQTSPQRQDPEAALLRRMRHELNNPLFSVLTAAQLLAEADENDRNRLTSILVRSSARLKEAMDDFLVFAELSLDRHSSSREPVDLVEMLRTLARARSAQAEELRVELELELPSGLPLAWADEGPVRAAAAHLFDHALRLSHPGGRVCVSAFRNQSDVEFQVAHNGDADPDAKGSSSFQEAPAPDPRRDPALWLGLVRRAVEALGGRALTRRGEGWNVFAVRLPTCA